MTTRVLFSVLLAVAGIAHAQQGSTTGVFMTFGVNESTQIRDSRRLQTTQNAKESRPSEEDPEGNWGETVHGFQLSVRFEKKTFRVGEPILADIYLRNVTDAPLEFAFPSGRGFGLCRFIVTRDGRESLDRNDAQRLFSFKSITLYPLTQWKWPARLTEMFKMDAPGIYLVTGVTDAAGVEIRSGDVLIRVVEREADVKEDTAFSGSQASIVEFGKSQENNRDQNDGNTRLSHGSLPKTDSPRVFGARTTNVRSPESLATASPASSTNRFTSAQGAGAGIIAGLVVLLLAILWRASRRKSRA